MARCGTVRLSLLGLMTWGTFVNSSRKFTKEETSGGDAASALSVDSDTFRTLSEKKKLSELSQQAAQKEKKAAQKNNDDATAVLESCAEAMLTLYNGGDVNAKSVARAFAEVAIGVTGVYNPVLGMACGFVYGLFNDDAAPDLKTEILKEIDVKIDQEFQQERDRESIAEMKDFTDYAFKFDNESNPVELKHVIDHGLGPKRVVFQEECWSSPATCWDDGRYEGNGGAGVLIARIAWLQSIMSLDIQYQNISVGQTSSHMKDRWSSELKYMVRLLRHNAIGFLRGSDQKMSFPFWREEKSGDYLKYIWNNPSYTDGACKMDEFFGLTLDHVSRPKDLMRAEMNAVALGCVKPQRSKMQDKYFKQLINPVKAIYSVFRSASEWQNYFDREVKASMSCTATFYEHGSYEGWNATLPPGEYSYTELLKYGMKNDAISGVKVDPGCKVTLYEHKHYKGRSKEFQAGAHSYVGRTMNDRTTSIKIQWTTSMD